MTASGTKVYPGIFKARCSAVKADELTVYVPQVFGDVPILIKDVMGIYPPPGTFGYVSFEGGDPAFPIWLGNLANTRTSLIGPQKPSYYGAFQYLGRQAITSTTTAYAMPLDTTDFSVDVTISNTSHVNILHAGVYNIQWSGQFQNTDNAIHDMQIWLRKNGINIPGSTGFVSIPARKSSSAGQEAHEIVGWNYFVQFNANDYFEIMWSSTSTTVSLESYGAGTNPSTPTTAAVIVTVSMV